MDIQDIIDKITECAEANGWHVHTERYRDTALWLFEFSQYTKAGQDFNFSAEMRYADPDTLIKSVREYYENYDPDEEAYLWIGDDGHGKNGAPYRISDIVADMEDAESLRDLTLTHAVNRALLFKTRSATSMPDVADINVY